MFVTFTYLFFLFVADTDLISMCVDFSLDSVCNGRYTIFANVLKIAAWMQSATDDPEFVLLLPRDIRFSTNEGVISGGLVGVPRMCRRFLKFAYDVVRV